MKHPYILARLDSKTKSYNVLNYNITKERQRPVFCKLILEEPVDPAENFVLSLGFDSQLVEYAYLIVLKTAQIKGNRFQVTLIEPLRTIFDSSYIDQLRQVSLDTVFNRLCSKIGLKFINKCSANNSRPKNFLFLSTIRNALDQIMLDYKLETERYQINLLNQTLTLLPGQIVTDAVTIPMDFFIKEFSGGVEFKIIPQLAESTPILWRDQERIVDSIIIDSITKSMFVKWVEDV